MTTFYSHGHLYKPGFFSLALQDDFIRLLRRNALVEILVDHHHRRGAATGQALDKFKRELAVLGRLRSVRGSIEAEFLAEMIAQRVAATKGAT